MILHISDFANFPYKMLLKEGSLSSAFNKSEVMTFFGSTLAQDEHFRP